MNYDVSHSSHWRSKMRVELQAQGKVNDRWFFVFLFIDFSLLDDLMIQSINSRLHGSSGSEETQLFDFFLDIYILVYF